MNSTLLLVLVPLSVIAAVVVLARWQSGAALRAAQRHEAIRQRGIAAAQSVAQRQPERPAPALAPVTVQAPSEPSMRYITPAPRAAPARWLAEGETVTVGGFTIAGGLLYVGDTLATPELRDEPAVIDPSLAVDARRVPYSQWSASYWPRYAGLTPLDRALYLQWLATGRCDPAAPIGPCFLYLYGIERYLLVDAGEAEPPRSEVPRLIAELDRLQRLYDHASFRRYASALRDIAVARFGAPARFRPSAPLDAGEVPPSLAIALGRLVHAGQGLPAGLAFDWARCLDDSPRASAYRLAAAELEALFERRYEAAYPAGLTIKPPKRRLTVEHHGAASNRAIVRLSFDLPDVRAISAPQAPLRVLLQGCLEELQALIRLRKRDSASPVELAAALPPDLRGTVGTEALAPLRDVLEAAVASASPARVDVARLLAAAGVSPGDRWGKREASALAVGLDALGFGIEPDVRFDGPVLDAAKPAVVFRLPQGSGKAPTAPYRMGQLLLQLAVAVAAADGAADPRELDEALVHLDRLFALETPERVRLQAHLVWLEAAPPSLARLTSRLKTLASTARAALADAVVSIAVADGRIDPKEMRTLEKVYRALGLDAATLPGDIHRLQTGPVPRPAATRVAPGLDADTIAAKLRETADVQRLLSTIFVDEETDAPAPPATAVTARPGSATAALPAPAGLDAAHAALLQHLLTHAGNTVEREDVEGWCASLGLMPDGALETVNEAAYAVAGDALLDVDDEICLRPDIRERMTHALQGAPA